MSVRADVTHSRGMMEVEREIWLSVISNVDKQLADIQVGIHLWIEFEFTCSGQAPNFIREAEKKKGTFPFQVPSSALFFLSFILLSLIEYPPNRALNLTISTPFTVQ